MDVLSTYDFTIEHRPGKLHGNADGLSKFDHSVDVNQHLSSVKMNDKSFLGNALRSLQDGDRDLRRIKGWLESKYCPNKIRYSESITVKSLYAQWDRLVINDDILYRRWTDLATQKDIFQAVVPSSERRSVLKCVMIVETQVILVFIKC